MAEVETKAAAHPAGAAVDERDFASLVRRHVAPFSAVKSLMERTVSGGDVARQAFAGIQQRAEDFVSFLDDHGARSNRTYAPLAEYAASVRGFAKMGRHLSHMEARLDRELPLPLGHENRFRDETRRTLEFVKWSLANLQEEALAEAGRLLGEPVHPPIDTQGDAIRDHFSRASVLTVKAPRNHLNIYTLELHLGEILREWDPKYPFELIQ